MRRARRVSRRRWPTRQHAVPAAEQRGRPGCHVTGCLFESCPACHASCHASRHAVLQPGGGLQGAKLQNKQPDGRSPGRPAVWVRRGLRSVELCVQRRQAGVSSPAPLQRPAAEHAAGTHLPACVCPCLCSAVPARPPPALLPRNCRRCCCCCCRYDSSLGDVNYTQRAGPMNGSFDLSPCQADEEARARCGDWHELPLYEVPACERGARLACLLAWASSMSNCY